jgi:hypothetical protein
MAICIIRCFLQPLHDADDSKSASSALSYAINIIVLVHEVSTCAGAQKHRQVVFLQLNGSMASSCLGIVVPGFRKVDKPESWNFLRSNFPPGPIGYSTYIQF